VPRAGEPFYLRCRVSQLQFHPAPYSKPSWRCSFLLQKFPSCSCPCSQLSLYLTALGVPSFTCKRRCHAFVDVCSPFFVTNAFQSLSDFVNLNVTGCDSPNPLLIGQDFFPENSTSVPIFGEFPCQDFPPPGDLLLLLLLSSPSLSNAY